MVQHSDPTRDSLNVIAFDTSGDSAVVAAKGQKTSWCRRRLNRATAETLVAWLDAVSRRAALTCKNTTVIGVGLGPGSLTSVRVGLAAAKALAWATQWPLVGFNSLDLLAMGIPVGEATRLWVVRDARRHNVYVREYEKFKRSWKPMRPCALMEQGEWMKILRQQLRRSKEPIGVGFDPPNFQLREWEDLVKKYPVREISFLKPKPSALLQLTQQSWRDQGAADPETLLPLYLYADDCQVQTK